MPCKGTAEIFSCPQLHPPQPDFSILPPHDTSPKTTICTASARPWRHRSGRLGAGLQGHYSAGRVLRRKACDSRLFRCSRCELFARQQPCQSRRGTDARIEHAAVFLGQKPPAAKAATGTADLSARGRGRGPRINTVRRSMSAGRLSWLSSATNSRHASTASAFGFHLRSRTAMRCFPFKRRFSRTVNTRCVNRFCGNAKCEFQSRAPSYSKAQSKHYGVTAHPSLE